MKTATFDNSVKVLLNAYLNDTLKHADCSACLVGNLVGRKNNWAHLFHTRLDTETEAHERLRFEEGKVYGYSFIFGYRQFDIDNTPEALECYERAMRVVKDSGYTVHELEKLEYAFETAPKGNNDDDWMFNGLMSGIDVLAEIHNVDLTTVKETKELFV